MRNYVKKDQKLPMFGIGPYLICGIASMNAVVLVLTCYVFKVGILSGIWVPIFRIVGAIIIVLGIAIWFIGSICSGMDESITDNKLKTDGIYAWVRNPMYTGFWLIVVGVSFIWHNILFIPMIFVDWLIMTIVLRNTEEKWLLDLYGEEYAEYKSRVNRWFPRKPSKQ